MNAALRKHLKKLPYFLLYNYPKKLETYNKLVRVNKSNSTDNKLPLNAYKSPSPMNELCEYIETWAKKKILWNTETIDSRVLITNSNIESPTLEQVVIIKHAINAYREEYKKVMELLDSYGTENREMYFDNLASKYIDSLKEDLGIQDEEIIANHVIYASYMKPNYSKLMAWNIFGDYILKNLADNSNPSKHIVITEVPYETNDTYEYLGKYYTMTEAGSEVRTM